MLRWLVVVVLLGTLLGCAKQALPDIIVRAGSEEELAAFRAELVERFGTEPLVAYDTALRELQLAGMERFPSAAERAAAMRAAVNGQTVRAAEILGWQARRARLLAEIKPMAETLERDLQTRERYGAGTPVIVANRIQNVQDILARLRGDLLTAEQQLEALSGKQ
ncbi:MAG: hypothetical protein HYV95_06265 [Opitutae bacterium]|nr:hypothetical protein [Opitutae bacterium]